MEVMGSGTGEVGSVYTLTCTVTLSHRARDSSVSILWHGPSTDEQTVDTTDNREVTRQLSLDPLSLAHGGNYTCTASYSVDGGGAFTISDTEIVVPSSKFKEHKTLHIFMTHNYSSTSICKTEEKSQHDSSRRRCCCTRIL